MLGQDGPLGEDGQSVGLGIVEGEDNLVAVDFDGSSIVDNVGHNGVGAGNGGIVLEGPLDVLSGEGGTVVPDNALTDGEGDGLAVLGNFEGLSQQAVGGSQGGVSIQQTLEDDFLMPEQSGVGSGVLQEVDSAGIGVQGLVLTVDVPVQDVLLIEELVVAGAVASHIQLVRGDNPGGDVEQRNDGSVGVFVLLDSVVSSLLILGGNSDLSGVDQSVQLVVPQNGGVVGSGGVMAVVELAQSQSVGTCEADVPVNSGGNAVGRGAPQQNGQVVGQQLEFHVDTDHCPVALDSGDGVQQVCGVVNSLDGVGAIPACFGQQLLGQLGVVGILGQTVSLPGAFGNQRLLGGDNGVVPQAFHDGIHINGIPQSLTDTGILQGMCVGLSLIGRGGCGGCSGSISLGCFVGSGSFGAAAGDQTESHCQNQQQSDQLLHLFSS